MPAGQFWLLAWLLSPVLCRGSILTCSNLLGQTVFGPKQPCVAALPWQANPASMLNLASLLLPGEVSPGEVAQAVEPAQAGGYPAFLARDLLGGVINVFISRVLELTVLTQRSSVFTWQRN